MDMQTKPPGWVDPPAPKWGSTNGGTPYFQPGEFKDFRAGLTTLIWGPVMWRIGTNWYAKTNDWEKSLWKAIYWSAAWKAWGFAVFAWFFNNWWIGTWYGGVKNGSYDPDLGPVLQWMGVFNYLVLPCFLLAAYRKLIDASLFKERIAYRIAKPFNKVFGRLPWWALIWTALMPAYIWIIARV